MQNLDKSVLKQLSSELALICSDMLELESSLLKSPVAVHEAHRRSARNLAHYLALRRRDIRRLQSHLAVLGLSSLGRIESHVLDAVQTVHRVLNVLLGSNSVLPSPAEPAVELSEGTQLLEANTNALLGSPPPERKVRIMVTVDSNAGSDYELVRDLVDNGMDCMRINCAHDNPATWLGMICNVERARKETGRNCRILMDISGPKLRTGPIEPGPSVIKCRPKRDVYGRVVAPARIWLTTEDHPERSPSSAAACIPVSNGFVESLRPGERIRLHDARKARRSLRIARVQRGGCWAEARQTIYFVPGLQLRRIGHGESSQSLEERSAVGRIGKLPPLAQTLLLKQGDTLILKRSNEIGRPAVFDQTGQLLVPAHIGVTLPQILEHAKPGEPIWFDDGKIGGIIREVRSDAVSVEITQARIQGEKLAEEKGINLPET